MAAYDALHRGRVRLDALRALRHKKPGTPPRILHVSRVFSAPSETFTYDLIRGLEQETDADNYVAYFERNLPRERPFAKLIKLHGTKRADLIAATALVSHHVDAVVGRIAPDLIHCHFGWVGLPLSKLLEKRGHSIPVVITIHGSDINQWPREYAWYRDALSSSNAYPHLSFLTHSDTYRSRICDLGVASERVFVIPNSIAPSFDVDDDASVGGAFPRPYRIVAVGRFATWKGQEYLIRSLELVRDEGHDVSLSLIGYGPEERRLKDLADECGVSEYVHFVGRVPHSELPEMLRTFDLFVQPSIVDPVTAQEEGQPISVLEAIACGLPIIVTSTGAMEETVNAYDARGTATVVPPSDPEALSASIGEMVANRVTRNDQGYREAMTAKHRHLEQVVSTRRHYDSVMR